MNKLLSSLLLLTLATISFNAYASNQKQFMKHMKYANPVPNYVSVITKNADALELTAEQMAKVNAWNEANGPKMKSMVEAVITGEKLIKQASLSGAAYEEINKMADDLMATRKNIIVSKTKCRDYIMSVLSEPQWKQLAKIISA